MVTKEEKIGIIGMIVFIFTFILIIIAYRFYSLTDCKCTIAVYKGIKGSGAGIRNTVMFSVDKKKIEAEVPMDLNLKIGDTIWIKYSTMDPTIVEIKDFNYKKYILEYKCE